MPGGRPGGNLLDCGGDPGGLDPGGAAEGACCGWRPDKGETSPMEVSVAKGGFGLVAPPDQIWRLGWNPGPTELNRRPVWLDGVASCLQKPGEVSPG